MRFLIISCLLFSAVLCYNCTRKAQNTDSEKAVLYPNLDSELALLMREMDADFNKIKQAIIEGKDLIDIRAKFAKIHTATPTDSTTKTGAFDAMAKSFLANVEKIYTLDDKRKHYNMAVNDCLNCHKLACPGPTVRIKKLVLE